MIRIKSKYFVYILSLILFLAVWHFSVIFFKISPWILPKPYAIFEELLSIDEYVFSHIRTTLLEASVGLILSVVIALILYIFIYSSKTFNILVKPYLILAQAIPIITVAPLIIIWFGYGIYSKIAVVVFVCSFPIVISLSESLKTLKKNQVNFFVINGATKIQTFRYLIIPHSLPFFFSGFRIAATYAITGAIIGEWLGANSGLGVYLTRVSKSFQTEKVFLAIFLISILSLLLYFSVVFFEYLVMPWKRKRNEVIK